MERVDVDRELLYGVTALRLGLIDLVNLNAAIVSWNTTRASSLAKVFAGRGLIPPDRLAMLDAEFAKLLKSHNGDASAGLSHAGPLAEELGKLLDTDPFGTLSDVSTEVDYDTTAANVSLPGSKHPRGADNDATLLDAPSSEVPTLSEGRFTATTRDPGAWLPNSTASDAANLRYQVLRMHAKGGLGQVFVARDAELNREVALKEIQGPYADQHESRLRFLIEAEVTGGLEHPGIVPVYGLGRYPDGRPYYAMRFIRGMSMKEAIDRYHDGDQSDRSKKEMELRKLLGQLVDVCNAMNYAHTRGVLHRDLKPGNIMLGGFGETLVVDWGLAKFKDAPEGTPSSPTGLIRPMSAGSSSQTLFGSAVGTPQYMSPEQAAGEHDKLGPPSDIYSLGSILYTILTGGVPFSGRGLHAMLYQVSQGDFPPPIKVNPKIHPALNAICLEAMALRPEDRYATSVALADDLEHWMADEPVSVYREPILARLARWAKRHKTAVASTAALLITGIVSLAIYSVLIKQEQARTARFYGLARLAVDRMLTELGQEDLADIPQMELVRKKMLAEAREFYGYLLKERGNDAVGRADLARAGIRLGDIETLVGEDAEAEKHYNLAIETLVVLRKNDPPNREYQADLGRAYHGRGVLFRKLGRLDEAERDFKSALELRTELTRTAPASASEKRDRIDTLYRLAALHANLAIGSRADPKAIDVAEGEYNQVIKQQEEVVKSPDVTLDDRRMLGRYVNNLGMLLKARGENKSAIETFRRAETIQDEVVGKQPKIAITRYELAKTNGNLHLLLASEKSPEAGKRGERDLELTTQLSKDFPKITDFSIGQFVARAHIGKYLIDTGQPELAGKELDEAITKGKEIVRDHGDRREARFALGSALYNRSLLALSENRLPDAEADLVETCNTLKPLAEAKTPIPEDLSTLGDAYSMLSSVRSKRGDKNPTTADLDEAIKYHQRASLLENAPEGTVPALWNDYLRKFGLLRLRTDAGVIKELDDAVSIGSKLATDHPKSRVCLAIHATALLSRGETLLKTREPAKAEGELLKARDILEPLADAKPPIADDIKELGTAEYVLAKVRAELGHPDEALVDLNKAIALHERVDANPSLDDASVSALWKDLDFKFRLLANRKPKPDYIEEANVAERLPALRPKHTVSAINAARALAACTFSGAFGGNPPNGMLESYAERTLKVLSEAAEAGTIDLKELDQAVYSKIRDRPEFAAIRKTLERKAKPKPTA